jgi:acid phosphatase (class A)
MSNNTFAPMPARGGTAWISTFTLTALLAFSSFTTHSAEPRYISPEHVDGVALLAPPPEPGSAEQEADLASARSICKSRTPEQEAAALKSATLSMFLFAPAIGEWFKPGQLPRTESLFNAVKVQIGGVVDDPKQEWKRARPYQLDPELTVGKAERSYSYPSGHTTRGVVYSMLFAQLMPEKREEILRIGRQIGWDRVIIGKHFPTDVYAGRVLGKAIFRALESNNEFQKAMAEARTEMEQAARQAEVAAK